MTTAVLSFLFYAIGACGVRRNSTVAAVIITAWHLLGQAGDGLMGLGINVRSSLLTLIVATTIRSSWVAGEADFQPEGSSEIIRFTDDLARPVWKITRYPYLTLGVAAVVLSGIGTVMAIRNRSSAFSLEPVSAPAKR